MSEYRVGTGFDAHALEEGVPLVLGGVRIEHPRGLAGHSDGDVLAHALTDALLGAAGLEDIGALFPSDGPKLAGADSLELLAQAWERVQVDGWQLANADVVLVGEEPRLAPRRVVSSGVPGLVFACHVPLRSRHAPTLAARPAGTRDGAAECIEVQSACTCLQRTRD